MCGSLCFYKKIFPDAKEITVDSKRAQTFSEIMFTLNKMAGGVFELPDTSEIFELFGKVRDFNGNTNEFLFRGILVDSFLEYD